MVTTFVRSAGNRTKELWQFIEEASRADMRLAEMGHDSLNELSAKCTGRVPIYVHPSFYRSLKLRFPYDVGGISRSSRVTPKLCTGSLRQCRRLTSLAVPTVGCWKAVLTFSQHTAAAPALGSLC